MEQRHGWQLPFARARTRGPVAVERPARFAFRWEPGGANEGGPTTLVEFRLEEIQGGTRLTLVESGFSRFGIESRQGNEYGWDSELGELRTFLLERAAA